MKLVLQSVLCDVLWSANFMFYYNFITIELEKLNFFLIFSLQKRFFFSQNEMDFYSKTNLYTQKSRGLLLFQILKTSRHTNIKETNIHFQIT